MEITAHTVCAGEAEGEAVVYRGPFSFLGDLDPATGKVPVPGHELEGQSLADKVFVFTTGKGSSGGPRFAWAAKRNGKAPIAIICLESEPVLSCAVIAAGIPTVDKPDADLFDLVKTGDHIRVDATHGIIELAKN
jgi:predicted aconitase with swiveling domain